MQKGSLEPSLSERKTRAVHWKALRVLRVAAVAASCWAVSQFLDDTKRASACRIATSENREFDWLSIQPSKDLKWVNCYTGRNRQCARFAVPLDYADPNGEQAAIALLRVPAKVARDSATYRGPIFFNPGGPGGSGVDLINITGDTLQLLLGSDYDIIGFDPRGIGRTTPQVNVFSDEVQRALWERSAGPLINASVDALAFSYERSNVFNRAVAHQASHAAEHVSTAVVARDMLSITQAHGRDKLLYWGFSYGTVLGATYAAMFPDNVGRIVADGVVDITDYYATLWSTDLVDTDKGLIMFYESCVQAGPSVCPIYEPTVAGIASRVNNLMESIKKKPLGSYHKGEYRVITYTTLRSGWFKSLYEPYLLLPKFAQYFAEIEHGDASALVEFLKDSEGKLECDCPSALPRLHHKRRQEADLAVACTDGAPVNDSLSEMAEYFDRLGKTSSFAELWTFRLRCLNYKVKAKWRFNGPFVGNTSYPMLFVGNTADPVTPLQAAKKTAKGYAGAVVLTQNSPGHCSSSAVSLCTFKYIRNYFRQGVLPPEGTVCEVESRFFDPGQPQRFSSKDDAEMFRLLGDLTRQFVVPHILRL